MIEAFTRRHTPQKARRDLTYEEQLGATGKAENQVPLFAPEEDEAEEGASERNSEDEDMVEVVRETLQNPFDDEAVARNLQEQEYAEPPSVDEPDMSEQMTLEASRREAARRRDEEDLALIRALRASKTDARLQFVAGEKEPSIAATKSTASVLGDSDEDDFEEVEVPHIKAQISEQPRTAPIPAEQGYFDLPLTAASGTSHDAPPLDSQDRALIEAAIRKDLTTQNEQSEKREPPARIAETDDTPKKPVEAKGEDSVRDYQPTPIGAYVPSSSKVNSKASGQPLQKTSESPSTAAEIDIESPSVVPEALARPEQSRISPKPSLPSYVGKTGRADEAAREVLDRLQPMSAIDQHIQKQPQISMNGLLDDQADASAIVPTITRSATPASIQSPIRRESPRRGSPTREPPRSESPLREMKESGNNNFSDSEDDELDDSRSLEWSLSPEPEPRQTQTDTFPAPPPGLEEDEGGIDMNAEGDDYARFLASIKHRNLEQVRQEIDNEIRNLNQQNKVAMRDSEEITHQMVAQIQVRRYRKRRISTLTIP